MSTPPSKPIKAPSYRLHKPSGQAVVTLSGRDCYLGTHGTEASVREYNRLIAEWIANGGRLPEQQAPAPELTVAELILRYWAEHVTGYYVKNGRPTDEQSCIQMALRPLNRLYGDIPAADFSPLKLAALRDEMIRMDWSRGVINHAVHRVRAMFRWAVARELLHESVHSALCKLTALAKGRSAARETPPVKPVPQAFIDAVRPLVSRQVRAMIDVQLLTAMRPGEVCAMRTADLDMSGKTWLYTPSEHKTEHHDKQRQIFIGPRAQEVIRPFLKPDLQAHLFSPTEAEEDRKAELARNRKTRVQPSQIRRRERALARARRNQRRRPPSDCYVVDAYRRAITRACDLAFPLEGELAQGEKESQKEWLARLTPEQRGTVADWRRQHRWHPHQLRHNAATFLRKEYGIEVARVILGHHSAAITEVYAEMDRTTAAQIMGRVG